ncbi:MAG: response regulator, partial [Owenweeksia sp.]
ILESWPDIKVVFESGDGFSVIEKLNSASVLPQVMLIDLSLPPNGKVEFNGIKLTSALQDSFPDIRIIILSAHDDESFIAQLIEEGAQGYLVKDSDPQEVYDAIVSVYTKGSYINERTLKVIQDRLAGKVKPRKMQEGITKREEEVLKLTCEQLTAEEIAERLFISVKTVHGHRNNLLQKTGSRNVTGLVLYAVKNQIIKLI